MNRTDGREPDPTAFNIILEGDPTKPRRIPYNRVCHYPPAKYQLSVILRALLDTAYVREDADIRPVIVTGSVR